ncbi:winged helix-turn-helix domain-containing protein [Sulfurimonas sp.]|uniref:response regulator transcription factor n=1 Tax=Sulfurimonas sp. TaxID=2022749 RepID=UPI00260E74AF|nr:winged helix-turn-helix domain-containing protein [Sulfurimonas sp.]
MHPKIKTSKSNAKEIKKRDKDQIILVTTAFDDKETLIDTINLKVDGFVSKPLDFDKLLELLKDKAKEIVQEKERQNIVKIQQDYYWDKQLTVLVYEGKNISLTKKERDLLCLLFSAPFETVFTYERIFEVLWGERDLMKHDSLKTIIKQLRKKLPFKTIKNIFAVGYAIERL